MQAMQLLEIKGGPFDGAYEAFRGFRCMTAFVKSGKGKSKRKLIAHCYDFVGTLEPDVTRQIGISATGHWKYVGADIVKEVR
jgi:hypothetical protein